MIGEIRHRMRGYLLRKLGAVDSAEYDRVLYDLIDTRRRGLLDVNFITSNGPYARIIERQPSLIAPRLDDTPSCMNTSIRTLELKLASACVVLDDYEGAPLSEGFINHATRELAYKLAHYLAQNVEWHDRPSR